MTIEKETGSKRRLSRWHLPIWWANGVAVIALLLSYLSIQIDPAQVWGPALFGIAYPYILLANVLCLVWWAMFRRRRMLPSLVAILIGWGYVGEYIQLFGDTAVPKEVGRSFTLMSWNVRLFDLYNWTHNTETREGMMDLIRVEDPDILCMQEFLKVDPGDPMTVKDSLLASYRYVACADAYTAHTRGGQHMGIAIFSRWPVLDQGTLEFPDDLNNLCLWADIAMGTDTVRIYTAHLASLRFADQDYAFMRNIDQSANPDSIASVGPRILARLKNAFIRRSIEVSSIVKHMAQCPYPRIYCGDLNDTPMGYSYHELLRSGLSDAFVESGQGIGHTYIGEFPSFRIDHILHDPRFKAWGFRTLPDELSDHRAITCHLGLVQP